ncbi:MAG: hypothetical protein IPM82_12600 [Saprospiraceae bacterium]|nr:hypothetical protein [Saprospiraceae bacterium]
MKNPKDIAIQQTGLKLKFNTAYVVASLIRSAADYLKKKPSEATFAEWAKAKMDSFQMATAQAADFASDFSDYFAYEFSMLLNSQKGDFQSLLDWCQNPF